VITYKSESEIALLKEGGKKLAEIVYKLASLVKPGMTGEKLNEVALVLIKKAGGEPSFLNYNNFPAAICVSVDNVVVHGVPSKTPFREGQIVSIDVGFFYKGLYTDMAVTVPVGRVSREDERLIKVTEKALDKAIASLAPGLPLNTIGRVIEEIAKNEGFSVVKDLVGHGVGYAVHEEPNVANYYRKQDDLILKPGLVLAIEPMLNSGSSQVIFTEDHAVVTKDGSKSAHFEKTVAIIKDGVLVLT